MNKGSAVFVAIGLALCAPAWAQQDELEKVEKAITALEQQTKGKGGGWLDLVYGVGIGYGWANSELSYTRKERPLYCPPNDLAMGARNYANILVKQYRDNKSEYVDFARRYASARRSDGARIDDHPADFLGQVLLDGLKKTYPCK